ncbi:hypothetical protein JHK87_018876 [Glycine soja]|nr:hypothetical protein JHK87_018876 [Glycine soja]
MDEYLSLVLQVASSKCYHGTSKVTDQLVQIILGPGLEPGAVEVFLEFICYTGGPLPEELLPQVKCPILIAWGDKDPWEPIDIGKNYENFNSVEDFIVLPNVGHCPQGIISLLPALVNHRQVNGSNVFFLSRFF